MTKEDVVIFLDKIDRFLISFIKIICAVLLIAMVVTISVSVFTRFVVFSPINFADALTKYLMIWLAFLGSGLSLRHREHIALVMILERLTEKQRNRLLVIIDVAVSIFLIVIIYYGTVFSMGGLTSTDPLVFGMKMIYAYLAVPVGALYALIHLNILTVKTILEGGEALR